MDKDFLAICHYYDFLRALRADVNRHPDKYDLEAVKEYLQTLVEAFTKPLVFPSGLQNPLKDTFNKLNREKRALWLSDEGDSNNEEALSI